MKLEYIGCSKEQTKWGSNDDPNDILVVGKIYTLKSKDVRTWHTKYELVEFPGKFFNSVCFRSIWMDG